MVAVMMCVYPNGKQLEKEHAIVYEQHLKDCMDWIKDTWQKVKEALSKLFYSLKERLNEIFSPDRHEKNNRKNRSSFKYTKQPKVYRNQVLDNRPSAIFARSNL